MLNTQKLVELHRGLEDHPVLSIYLGAEEHDPAARSAWRRRLNQLAARTRQEIDEASGERELFDRALDRVHEELKFFNAFLPDRGWIAFASPDRLWYAEAVPVPMPDLVGWGSGIRVAPYIRSLKQHRPVVALLLDRRRARLFLYRAGVLTEPVGIVAAALPADLSDTGASKHGRTHSGARGVTRTDAAQQHVEANAERLIKEALEKALELAGEDGFLVLGGTPEMVSAAARRLPKMMAGRVLENASLHVDMSPALLKASLEAAASAHSRELQNAALDRILDGARANGNGCLGRGATEHALRSARVELLLLSRRFREEEPGLAEQYVALALDQGAVVEEISGPGADLLDAEGGGIGARLRYQVRASAGVALAG